MLPRTLPSNPLALCAWKSSIPVFMCSKSKVYAGMSLLKQGMLRITFSYLSCDQGSIIVSLILTRTAGYNWSFVSSKISNVQPSPTQKCVWILDHATARSFSSQSCVILLVILQHGLFPSLSSSPPTFLSLASDVRGLHCCHWAVSQNTTNQTWLWDSLT